MSTSTPMQGTRPKLLCVDDDPDALEGLRDLLGRSFAVHTARGGAEGLQILGADPDGFAVVVSDMRMPRMSGTDFLRAAHAAAPDAVRLLLTGDADLDTAVQAVNHGHLFRFLQKPCSPPELLRACAAALGQHRLALAERKLLQETVRGSVDALTEILALANPAAFGRGSRVKFIAGELARRAGLRDWWEVEVAAMFAQVGAVTLPQATAEKLYAGVSLSGAEAEMARRIPALSRQLLGRIPRMEGPLEILARHGDSWTADDAPDAVPAPPTGAGVLRVAIDYAELESQQLAVSVALGSMWDRGDYDPRLLKLLGELLGAPANLTVTERYVRDLEVGMTLAEDARSLDDVLLLARGQRVTERLIERLLNLGPGIVREPLRILAADPDPEA